MARLRYRPEHMDRLVAAQIAHRSKAWEAGLIDPTGAYVPPQPAEDKPEPVVHEGHCVKCKTKRTVETEGVEPMGNGAHRAHGKCPVCGTTVGRFMSAADGKAHGDKLAKAKR